MISRINGIGYDFNRLCVYNPETVHLVPNTQRVVNTKKVSSIKPVEKSERSKSLQNDLKRRNSMTYGLNKQTKKIETKQTNTSHIIDAYA